MVLLTPTRIIWQLAGRPDTQKAAPEDHPATCLVCGGHSEITVPEKKAIPRAEGDRDQFRAPWSDRVCVACLWCSEGRPPDTLRMWSIAYSEEGVEDPGAFSAYMDEKHTPERQLSVEPLRRARPQLALVNKGDLTPVTRLLCAPPEDGAYFVSVADSGHVHTVRNAVLNRGDTWTIQFEREAITCAASDFARILYHACALRVGGFFNDEILSGEPGSRHLMDNPTCWMTHAPPLEAWIGSSVLRFTLFTITRSTLDEHYKISKKTVGSTYRSDADARGSELITRLPGIMRPEQD